MEVQMDEQANLKDADSSNKEPGNNIKLWFMLQSAFVAVSKKLQDNSDITVEDVASMMQGTKAPDDEMMLALDVQLLPDAAERERLGPKCVAELFVEAHEPVRERAAVTVAEARKYLVIQAQAAEKEWDEDEEWYEGQEEEEACADDDDSGGEDPIAKKPRMEEEGEAPKKVILLRPKEQAQQKASE
mmetsp:Transcript_48886/g.97201  ORF Transcript_48886/g.97201 Transcript_48886/m.97201 type:complete len:187 (+) Transcript_48886:27-587(+)